MARKAHALLIDLDGTLVDTVADLAGALNAVLAEQRRPALSERTVRGLVGRGVPRLVESGFAAAGAPADPDRLPALVRRFLAIYEAAPAARSRPYPGVAETLARWHAEGRAMAVCTNKPQAASQAILAEFGLQRFFRAVGGGDRFRVRKPDGRHLTATLRAAGIDGGPAVMIGDSAADLEAGRDAGLPVVLVDYGYSAEPAARLGADAVVSAFDRIPGVLDGLPRAGPAGAA